jgi:hypothetical protein
MCFSSGSDPPVRAPCIDPTSASKMVATLASDCRSEPTWHAPFIQLPLDIAIREEMEMCYAFRSASAGRTFRTVAAQS